MKKAFEYYTLAANQDHAGAQLELGNCYYNGEGVIEDRKKAIEYCILAAEQDTEVDIKFTAKLKLGAFYLFDYIELPIKKVANYYKFAAEHGDPIAQYYLATCYHLGLGVDENMVLAVKLYTMSADKGNMDAQNSLGMCYEIGNSILKNTKKAVEYYNMAAIQNHKDAQTNLGVCYMDGIGVMKDLNKAITYFMMAAKQNYYVAQYELALCYIDGKGCDPDIEKAYRFCKMAAKQKYEKAKIMLPTLKSQRKPWKCMNICGKEEMARSDFEVCSTCSMVCYCSTDCQRNHWKEHKLVCKELL